MKRSSSCKPAKKCVGRKISHQPALQLDKKKIQRLRNAAKRLINLKEPWTGIYQSALIRLTQGYKLTLRFLSKMAVSLKIPKRLRERCAKLISEQIPLRRVKSNSNAIKEFGKRFLRSLKAIPAT